MAVAPDGSIYFAAAMSYAVVYHVTSKGKLIGRPWSTLGQVRPDTFNAAGIALDAAGDVYVTDSGYNRIVVFSPAGKVLFTTDSPGTGPRGFVSPGAIAVAPDGTVYVANLAKNRLQKFGPRR